MTGFRFVASGDEGKYWVYVDADQRRPVGKVWKTSRGWAAEPVLAWGLRFKTRQAAGEAVRDAWLRGSAEPAPKEK